MTALLPGAMPRRTRQRLPVGIGLVLGEAEGVLAGIAQGRAIDGAGQAAADIAHDELQRAADRGVGAVALAQRIDAAVHADRLGGRAVDDHQRAGEMRGAEQAVQHEQRIERRLEHAQHHRHVFRLAARHHRVDRHLLDRAGREVGRDQAHDLVGLALGAAQHAQDALVGRRHDRQAVGPAALEAGLDRIVPVRRRRSRATSGRDRRSARSAPRARRARRSWSRSPAARPAGRRPQRHRRRAASIRLRSQPTVRSTSRPSLKRIRVGTASMLSRNERSRSWSSITERTPDGKGRIVLADHGQRAGAVEALHHRLDQHAGRTVALGDDDQAVAGERVSGIGISCHAERSEHLIAIDAARFDACDPSLRSG